MRNHLNILKDVPTFFNDDEINDIGKRVTLEEIEEIVRKITK